MRIALQNWYSAWLAANAGTDLFWVAKTARGEPFLPQVHRVRDELSRLVWADVSYKEHPNEPEPRTDCKETAWVIGEHTSKSVRLPVYSFERPSLGLRLVLRDNYYDWKLSVISERPITSELFPYLFHTTPPVEPDYTGDELASCYFEGFPKELVFGYHVADQRRWSASISDRGIWTVVFEIMRSLGTLKPHTWHTRESYRAVLAAQ